MALTTNTFISATSFHCELASCTNEYFIGDSDFLDSSPVVFVSPDVPPPEEVSHGEHGDCESA